MNNGIFNPYTASIRFDDLSFNFHVISKESKEQHDRDVADVAARGGGHPYYGYPQFRFIRDRMISAGDVIFDIGGEYGFTAILFSAWGGVNGQVLVFEPNPWFVNCISRNLKLNHVRHASVIERAVSSSRNEILDYGASAIRSDGEGMRRVVSACLDDYAGLFPDFLKVDVEGYEVEILKGAQAVLAQYPKLQIELHVALLENYGASVADFFALIDTSAYDFFIQWGGNDDPQIVGFDPEREMERLSESAGDHAVQLFGLPRPSADRERARLLTTPRRLRRDIRLRWGRLSGRWT
jgi:FkbM family methyltransferase